MPKSYVERIRDAGVVGAGGAGFPTHIKVDTQAEIIIANGIECEPLLKSDQEIMKEYAEEIIEGIYVLLHITGADRGVICIKEKYSAAREALREAIGQKQKVEIYQVGNYYPAGDEQQLIYEVTGRLVPVGGLPLDVGVVVNNVSTLKNVYRAVNDETAVIDRYVTVAGEVNNPSVFRVPIGTSAKKLIDLAGGVPGDGEYKFIVGGPAMGKVETDWSLPVTKTVGGIIVLPADHPLIRKKSSSLDFDYKQAKSVCIQCNNCTELCPRNALGFELEPHKVMRAMAYGKSDAIENIGGVTACCDCGVCTFYACEMGLSPNRIVTELKNRLLEKGYKPDKETPEQVSDFRDFKKVPTSRMTQRLGLGKYMHYEYTLETQVDVEFVTIPLSQHIGAPVVPTVSTGDSVEKGDLIGKVGEEDVGAYIHASISGVISSVTDDCIEIIKHS
ncbi:MAG: RnfABCDGE type electron transport complex subunit C [Bacillota bacterium]